MTLFPITLLASGNGSNVQTIIDQAAAGELPVAIKAIISNRPGAAVLARGERAGIATHCIDHTQYQKREEFDAALLACVQQSGGELVALLGFMRILTEVFVNPLRGRLINVHPSLLPKYPGLHSHRQALAAGDARHGATVHFVNEVLDGGPIIIQGSMDISQASDETIVRDRVRDQVEHTIVPRAIKWYAEKQLVLRDGKVWLDGEALPPQGRQCDCD